MQQPAVVPLGEQLERRQVYLVLASLMLALFLAALDQTIVATATPRILASLGGFDLFSWLFTSYLLSSTVVVPLVGKMSDIYGRRNFLLAGIIVFLAGSALCGIAPNMISLIIFRGLQGLGGGTIFATVFATTGDLFPPAERGRYIGFFTGVFSLASILGPTLGGLITDHLGWRWVFYVNVPVGAVAVPTIWFNLPARGSSLRPRIDYMGAVMLTISSVLLLLGLEFGGDRYAWGSFEILAMFGGAAAVLVLFIFWEHRHPEPIVPLHLFRNGAFVFSNLIVFTMGMAMLGAIAYLPTFVQTSLHTSATASGIVTTPQSVGVFFASIIGGQVLTRTGRYRWQTVLGAVLLFLAFAYLTGVSVSIPKWHIAAAMVVTGAGIGLVLPTMSVATQNAVAYRFLGVATSASQFFRQIGGVLGVAIFGTVLSNSYRSDFAGTLPPNVADGLGPQVVNQFQNPTVMLNDRQFAALQDQVRALPNGEALLSSAVEAVRESVAAATSELFLVAAAIAVVCIGLALFMRELPLRREFDEVQPKAPSPAAATAPEAAPVTEPVEGGSPAGGGR